MLEVMQLFIGYVHLWGFAFMEGCVANVLRPEAIQLEPEILLNSGSK